MFWKKSKNIFTFKSLTEKNPEGFINEDSFICSKNVFGVFDGVTGLDKYKNNKGKTGGYLASNIVKSFFLEEGKKKGLKDCAILANEKIFSEMEKTGIDITKKEILWGTTASVVKINKNDFEWIVVGDSPLIVVYQDGTHKVLCYQDHDIQTILLAKSLADKKIEGTLKDTNLREELMPQILEVRKKGNIDYGVMNGEPEMEKFLNHGVESLVNVKAILIISDGLLIPKKEPREEEKFSEIVSLFLNGGLEVVLKHVREIQDSDKNCWIYPRLKTYDDATGVVVGF